MRILVLVEGTLGHDMAGPSIRASGLARALTSRHEVTLAARGNPPGAHHGIPVIPYTRAMVLRAARAHDAVLAPWIPPYVHASRRLGTRLIADLYDPLELELRAVGADLHERRMLERLERLQAEHADVLLCATEAQARRLRARYPRAADKLLVVPFGVDPPPAPPDELAGPPDPPVVLWWGSLWRWLDPVAAVEALAELRRRAPGARLVFSAGRPRGTAAPTADADARRAAERLGVDGAVTFLEEWVPYGQRHEVLGAADVGLLLHGDADEARHAVRARVLDFVWAGLPCVLSGDDELALEIHARGGGVVLADPSPPRVADALASLVDPARRAAARAAMREIALARQWPAVAVPLLEWLDAPRAAAPGRPLAAVAGYYRAAARRQARGRGEGAQLRYVPVEGGDPGRQKRVLLISPVFNEAANIERVVRAMAAQTAPPHRWVVVDDGSTDGTLEILRGLAPDVPFMEVLERPAEPDAGATPDRLAVALEARAFNRGLRHAGGPDGYTHIGKLDGDIELPPDWLARLLEAFDRDPRLGIAGGTLIEPAGGDWRRLVIPEYHVHGAVKLYSSACFEAIGGIHERLAWDTIDETYARMRGYRTWTSRGLVARHLRPAASADGQLRGRARHGECAWILHYQPSWVVLRAGKVALDPPRVASGIAFLWGYARAAARRTPQVEDPEFRRFTRQELRGRLRGALPATRQRVARG